MLSVAEQAAVKAVLSDLSRGKRVMRWEWGTLLGVEPGVLDQLAREYPDLRGLSLEEADLAIHNALNLYVNGLSVSREEWAKLGVTLTEVEQAFESWQRDV